MKKFINRCFMLLIILAGMFIGMARGQQAKSKFFFKMKNKPEDKKATSSVSSEITLDEIEMATYHYSS